MSNKTTNAIVLPAPDDMHQHLREGDAMQLPIAHAALQFGRIMAMPNLRMPLCDSTALTNYLQQVQQHIPSQARLQVLGTLYLQENMDPNDVAFAAKHLPLAAVKWYPRGVTTNADQGISDFRRCYAVFSILQEMDIVLSVHGEVSDPHIDIFDREKVFIQEVLIPLRQDFPRLRIVLEHISTSVAVDYLRENGSDMLAATITPQHVIINRHHLLAGGIKPHYYCLPIVKREGDRKALLAAATSGIPWFFLGSDCAPHQQSAKESACGCAGCYTGEHIMALYAQVFDSVGKITALSDFASKFAAEYYRMPPATGELHIEKKSQQIPHQYQSNSGTIIPFMAGETLAWQVTHLR